MITEQKNSKTEINISISSERGAEVDGSMFGLFFEDINYAADGGIMAEMIENSSFEFFNSEPAYDYGWKATGDGAVLQISDEYPMNANNTHCAKITVTDVADGIKNKAYDGIYMNSNCEYNVSLYARGEIPVIVSAGKDGKVFGSVVLKGDSNIPACVADGWKKYSGVLRVSEDIEGGDFVIGLSEPGAVYIDMVSCVSSDAVLGRFRKDLVEHLEKMNPGFLRFPGGCAVEGGATLDTAYRWKDTVGAVEERKLNKSRWQVFDAKHYCQSYNLGFYEYFILCEYLGADPVPVVNAGLACMTYEKEEAVPVYKDSNLNYDTASESDITDEFMEYVDDILDLIDFANSTDFENNKWAALRKSMGHEAPFDLRSIGVGNEQWERNGNQWRDRYYWIEHFVHKKDSSIRLMSSAAWYYTGNSIHDGEYAFVYEQLKKNPNFTYAVDEHYYETPDWFFKNMDYYDKYSREANVFLGEVSARWEKDPGNEKICTLENAIVEAAYFTMLERNSDIIKMVSAAPLLSRTGGTKYSQWSPNLIWFDGKSSYATPSYHVQTMYGQNTGDYNYKSLVSNDDDKRVFVNTTYAKESQELIIKLVNSSNEKKTVNINIDSNISLSSDKAKIIALHNNDNQAYNSIDNPECVAPVTTYAENISHRFTMVLGANSFTIVRI